MKRILILTGRYLPGHRDGGPVRSIQNLVDWLGSEVDIRIMCLDRDHGDEEPYPDIAINQYNQVGKAKVWYTQAFNARDIAVLADDADLVYCCGPYSGYAIAAMRLKKNGRMKAPLVVASMGSFSPDAFAIKGRKKSLFIKGMRFLGLFKKVIWSVTSQREERELKDIIGENAECMIASDLPRAIEISHISGKNKNEISLVFISRISRKKNLIVIPDILKRISDGIKISIDIYGIAEDEDYQEECREAFEALGEDIKWEFKGEVDSEQVPSVLAEYDAFLFPTLGENYGHVIAEALVAGCVPIISDRTPWLDFDKENCGYVCRLENLDDFANAITELSGMDINEYEVKSRKCQEYIGARIEEDIKNTGYRDIFGLAD